MSEEEITFSITSMKIDALEEVLTHQQLEKYRKLLILKKESFIKTWSKSLTNERLEEALVGFNV